VTDAATSICARLVREGAVPRDDIPDLDRPDVRRSVEERLEGMGLVLATSAYSDHVGIRLAPEVTAGADFDAASNLGLRSDACALLVVLWARLVLQKRTAEDTRETPGQAALFAAEKSDAARAYAPRLRFETLAREFGDVFGSRSHLKRLLTQLRRLRFVGGRGDLIEAGPLLELAIDGERMIAFLRRGVLARLTEERELAEEPPGPGDRVLEALRELGGSAPCRALAETLELPIPRVRSHLNELIAEGLVIRTGARQTTRYHLPGAGEEAD